MKFQEAPSLFFLILTILTASHGLFEDQAFKFDWRQQYVGIIEDADFWDTSASGSGVIVRTASNVLASLDADAGYIRWRHIFTDARILEAALDESGGSVATISRSTEIDSDFTLSLWNADTGILVSEQRLTIPVTHFHSAFSHLGKTANIINVSPDGAVKVYSYDFRKGNLVDTYTFSTGASDINECVNLDTAFVCLSNNLKMVYHTSLPFARGGSFSAVPLSSLIEVSETPLSLARGSKSKAIVRLSTSKPHVDSNLFLTFGDSGKLANSNVLRQPNASSSKANVVLTGCKNNEDEMLLMEQDCGTSSSCRQVKVTSLRLKHESIFKAKFERGRLLRAWASCEPASNEANYQLLMLFEDGSISSVTPLGNLMWSREEGLADIAAVQLVSKGLHMNEAAGDDEEADELSSLDLAGQIYDGAHERDILAQLGRRLRYHAAHLHSIFSHIFAVKDISVLLNMKDTSVDDFGIRKMIVAATRHGKLYGVDSISGKVMWQIFFGGKTFQDLQEPLYLFVQRSSYHYGFEARCSLLYRNAENFAELLYFNPLNGKTVDKPRNFGRKLVQASLLHHTGEDHIRPILLLFEGLHVELEPTSAAKQLLPLSGKMFLAVLDPSGDRLQGNRLTFSKEGTLSLSPVWSFTSPGAKILRVVGKPTDEVVHSQGRVMADRSVLFKYINPNLALILTEGKETPAAATTTTTPSSTLKTLINVYLIDLVTGRVVFSTNHKRVVGPYHVVHSENWAIYTYYNEKARRAELISLELYEGTSQSNSTVFSSLSNKVTPLVERQAFILGPTYVTAIKDTITDKGITSKHLLMATAAGAIYDVSRHVLDPRRPNMNTPPEMREPGLPPYIPELQFPPEVVLNYNQSVALPRGIQTAPTDLESTSVIFVHGLDLYCTRVTPSKGFDLLKDDFDYFIISAVLFALIAASVATRKFSQLKNLKMAWR